MSNLQQRLLSAIVAIPILIWLFYLGGPWFLLLVEVVILVGMSEFFNMVKVKGLPPLEGAGTLAAMALGLVAYSGDLQLLSMALAVAVMAIFALELRNIDLRFAITGTAVTLLGLVYVGFLFSHVVLLRNSSIGGHPKIGFFFVLIRDFSESSFVEFKSYW